ncbi:MAG: enoyl-CoA hydratase-related protein [Actinomycetota bacterium]
MSGHGDSLVVRRDGPALRVTLDRAERHNAVDDRLVADLTSALEGAAGDPAVRCLVLAANGRSFSAGADLAWMRRMGDAPPEDAAADALALARLYRVLDRLPVPTVALVQGGAHGGGVGLVAACDVAIAVEDAAFSLPEVRLGLVPAVISPYLVAAVGARQARRLTLTGERITAREAARLGLVHRVVPDADALEREGAAVVADLARGAPAALAAAKDLFRAVAPVDDALVADTARRLAEARSSPEGREGVRAFLERRTPPWQEG